MMILVSFSLLFIVLGSVYLWGKDTVWSWTRWNNQVSGVKSERTQQWESYTTITGCFFLVISGLLLIVSFWAQLAINEQANHSNVTLITTDASGKKVERRLTKEEALLYHPSGSRNSK
jgi:hypothetical protein